MAVQFAEAKSRLHGQFWEFNFMKMGKITAFITAIVAILTTFSFLTPATAAFADEATGTQAEFLFAYNSYDSNFVFGKLAEQLDEANKADYANYKYTFSYEPTGLTQSEVENYLGKKVGDKVGEGEDGKTLTLEDLFAEMNEKFGAKDIEVKVSDNKLSESGSKKLTFNYQGEYKAILKSTLKNSEDTEHAEKEPVELTFKTVSSDGLDLTPAYNFGDLKALKQYAATVKETASGVGFGDDFTFPDIKNLYTTNYYAKEDAKLTLFYMTPSASSFSKSTVSGSSSKEFELSSHGKYTFYIALANPVNDKDEAISLNDYELKDDGYYKDDEKKYYLSDETFSSVVYGEGEEDPDITGVTVQYLCDAEGNKIYPVFSFNYSGMKAPKVIKSQSEGQVHNAYYGLTYTNVSKLLTVESVSDSQTQYRLYFSKTELSKDKLVWADAAEWSDKIEDNKLYDVTDEKDFAFSESTRNFNVAEKGYYYVTCDVSNEFGGDSAYVVINGTKEISKISYTRDWGKEIGSFFKNNTTSVIFLGIAILSFIGLMLVIFIKPKDAKVEENVTPKSKD